MSVINDVLTLMECIVMCSRSDCSFRGCNVCSYLSGIFGGWNVKFLLNWFRLVYATWELRNITLYKLCVHLYALEDSVRLLPRPWLKTKGLLTSVCCLIFTNFYCRSCVDRHWLMQTRAICPKSIVLLGQSKQRESVLSDGPHRDYHLKHSIIYWWSLIVRASFGIHSPDSTNEVKGFSSGHIHIQPVH